MARRILIYVRRPILNGSVLCDPLAWSRLSDVWVSIALTELQPIEDGGLSPETVLTTPKDASIEIRRIPSTRMALFDRTMSGLWASM